MSAHGVVSDGKESITVFGIPGSSVVTGYAALVMEALKGNKVGEMIFFVSEEHIPSLLLWMGLVKPNVFIPLTYVNIKCLMPP